MLKQLFIILLCGLSVCKLSAQQDTTIVQYDKSTLHLQQISEDDLQAYKEDPKFDYEIVKVDHTWWDNFKTWLGNLFTRFFEWLFGAEKAGGYLLFFLKILPYLLIGILLFLLIKFFLNVNARALLYSKDNETVVSLSDEAHIIKNEDINQLIQNALKDKNYRLAIRYYYLLILKQMSEKELINWEMQKTNDDYINELEKEELKAPFSHITLLYDYIWYGDFPIDEAKYLKAETKFSSLRKTLDIHE